MKHILLLLLSCLAASALPEQFKVGQAYNYRYKGFILSGAPDHSKSYAGFLVNSMVYLRYLEDSPKGKIFTLNLFLTDIDQVANTLDFDPTQEVSPHQLKVGSPGTYKGISQGTLELPVQFVWSKTGEIVSFSKTEQDTIESLNIKRSLVSMLNGEFGRIPANHGSGIGMIPWKMQEEVDGNCGTGYSFSAIRPTFFEMVKHRDLTKCKSSPSRTMTNFNEARSPCKNPFERREPTGRQFKAEVEAQTRAAVIRKKSGGFFIQSIVTSASYGVVSPGKQRHDLAAKIKKMLTFDSIAEDDEEEEKKFDFVKASIVMELPPKPEEFKSKDEFEKQVKEVLKVMKANEVTVEFAKKQIELAQLLRRATFEQIKGLLLSFKERTFRGYVGNLLSMVGTDASNKAIVGIAQHPSVPDRDAAGVLSLSAFTSSNPGQLAKGYRSLLLGKALRTKTRKETLKATIIGVGSLLNRLRTEKGVNYSGLVKNMKEAFGMYMKIDMKALMSEEDKILSMLMSLGNAGYRGTEDILENFLTDKNTLKVRLQAMRSWRKLAAQVSQRTRNVMYPILANKHEDTEIRINAFMNLARSKLSNYHMALIAQFLLQKDTDENVRNFIVSYYVTIARIKRTTLCKLKDIINARRLLRMLPRSFPEVSMTKSRVFVLPSPSGQKWMVVFGYIIHTRNSLSPRTISFTQSFLTENREGEFFEVEMRSFGGQRVLYDAFDKLSKATKKQSSSQKSKQTDTIATVRLSMFGDDVSLKDERSMDIMKVLTGFSKLKSLLMQDYYMEATSFGLPLFLQRSMSLLHSSKYSLPVFGAVKANVFKVNAQVQLSELVLMEGVMGVEFCGDTPRTQIDTATSVLPGRKTSFHFKYRASPKETTFQVTLQPAGKRHVLLNMSEEIYMVAKIGKAEKPEVIKMDLKNSEVFTTEKYGYQVGFPVEIVKNRPSKLYGLYAKMNGRELPRRFSITLHPARFNGFAITLKSEDVKKDLSDDESSVDPKKLILKPVKKFSSKASDDYPAYRMGVPDLSSDADMKFKLQVLTAQGMKITVASGEATLRQKSRSIKMEAEVRIANLYKLILKASIKDNVDVYFNPSNPFEITQNIKRTRNFKVKVGGNVLYSMTLTSKISDSWANEWKAILKSDDVLRRQYPYMINCITYGSINKDYANSPFCIKTWTTLQRFNDHSVEMSYPPNCDEAVQKAFYFAQRAADKLRINFSGKVRSQKATVSVSITPNSFRLRQISKLGQLERIMAGKCDVGINKEKKNILVNTFDGEDYFSRVRPELFKDMSLIIAQEKFEGHFTVAYAPNAATIIKYNINGKDCVMTIKYSGDETEIDSDGDGCENKAEEDTAEVADDGVYYLEDAVDVRIPSKDIRVITRPGQYVRVLLGKRYFGSVRGVCGGFSNEQSLVRRSIKTCKRVPFRNVGSFVKDYIVKDYSKLPLCE